MGKGWYERDGVQVVPDLVACDESELDLSLPVRVEGIPQDSEVSCRNTLTLLRFLQATQSLSIEPLLKTANIQSSLTHLMNPHKWVSYAESLRVFDLARRFCPSPNPRHFLQLGRFAHSWQTLGPGIDALANFLPLEKVMWLAASYARLFNNGQFVRSVRSGRGELTVISRYAEFVKPTAIFDQDWWALGIYSGFPERRSLPPARVDLEYTEFTLDHLLDHEYGWLGRKDHGIRFERTYNGFDRGRWFVEGAEYAHEIVLLRESLVEPGPVRGEDLFHPKPHELEGFSPEELRGMLEKRKAARAWLVTDNLERDSELIVKQGEIWGAPYSRFRVNWQERSRWRMLVERVVSWRHRMVVSHAALRSEIEAAKAEAMHADRERLASERKSVIFQTYARHSLIERIDRGEDPRTDRPKRQHLAVLFSDLREFTRTSGDLEPEELVSFLNSYYNRLNRPIFNHRGEVDKIMGDGMMATFPPAPGTEPESLRAVQAAIDVRRELQAFNRERWEEHLQDDPDGLFQRVDNGIGISWGHVVVGNIGSDHKMEHTLIGDVVNVASRLEGLTRHYGSAILITEDVRSRLPDRFHVRFLDVARLKGRGEPVSIHEVFDHEPESVRERKLAAVERMTEAWTLYAGGLFAEAGALYREIRATLGPHRLQPELCLDPAVDYFSIRCNRLERLSKEDPTLVEGWNGVHLFNEK